jgi:hypothetical protein
MHRLRLIFTAIALLLLNACATPIQVENYSDGFATTWQSTDRFTVSYRNNPDSTAQMATDLALLHSAEIALQHGFYYFILVNNEDSNVQVVTPAGNAKVAGAAASPYRLASPAATNRIIGFQEKPPGFHYVALFVKASLRTRYALDHASPSS